MKRIKRFIYYFIDRHKRNILKTMNVYLEKGVQSNDKTIFESHIKIYANAQVLNSGIGKGTYIGYSSVFNDCLIGRFCSIASSSKIIYGSHPSSIFISTHPAFFSKSKQAGFSFTDVNLFVERNFAIPEKSISVIIGNDVWIGFGAAIMEGVKVGDGAIIAAGALVTKDVPPYSIVAGIPAKIIKYRFSSPEIDKLLELKWWNKDFNWIRENYKLFSDISNLYKII